MEITGVITKMLEPVTGSGQKGDWVRQDVILNHVQDANYPKYIVITFFNKEELLNGVTEGSKVTVQLDINCTEYNGKWYNNVNGWALDIVGVPINQTTQEETQSHQDAPAIDIEPEEESDLPF